MLNGYKPLYEKSILHRDIKPENILISKDTLGKPIYKLADFGIGKVCASNDTVMTKVGTPVYAAPELNSFVNDDNLDKLVYQLKEIKNGKSQVDVFSVSIFLIVDWNYALLISFRLASVWNKVYRATWSIHEKSQINSFQNIKSTKRHQLWSFGDDWKNDCIQSFRKN